MTTKTIGNCHTVEKEKKKHSTSSAHYKSHWITTNKTQIKSISSSRKCATKCNNRTKIETLEQNDRSHDHTNDRQRAH